MRGLLIPTGLGAEKHRPRLRATFMAQCALPQVRTDQAAIERPLPSFSFRPPVAAVTAIHQRAKFRTGPTTARRAGSKLVRVSP